MTEKDLKSVKELTDKELVETYKEINKVAPHMIADAKKQIMQPEIIESKDNYDDRTLDKAKENAEEAKKQKKKVEDLRDRVNDEIKERDIDPYEFKVS